ncbi:Glycerophosphocholine phosphodiesterase GPCPD1 [Holothuria leucospilota]|uniref:Glycerophosphocholine phosphodiesterase GPCPD1 n=1 Tax=Holothuria leucospilota TaxID=206669 RepID=A0A9Q1C5K5_HOLLE|nr:Glycerophosphocholine phosphodiesterase GPCPD1 [Holothuria leucospilota]
MPEVQTLRPLVSETELRLSVSDQPFSPFDGNLNKSGNFFHIKVSCVEVGRLHEKHAVYIRVYNNEEYSPKLQEEFGRPFKTGEFGVFSTQTSNPSNMILSLEVYHREDAGQLNSLGNCLISGSEMGPPRNASMVVTSREGSPVGLINVRTHAIRPWENVEMYSTLPKQTLKRPEKTQLCGHRGMGRTTREKSLLTGQSDRMTNPVPENTLAAFKEAHKVGLSFVEFDVHVTQDGVPIVFHDFETDLGIQQESCDKVLDLVTANVGCMSYKQIQVLRDLKENPDGTSKCDWICSFVEEYPEDRKPCPTLKEALENVSKDLAFHVEIKYPMKDEHGNKETISDVLDRNLVVDAVMDVIYKYGGARQILFSTFDPDLCVMLKLKQHRYPVLLANYGKTEKYASYEGLRCSSARIALNMVLAEKLEGINGHSDDYVADPSLVQQMHHEGLCLFVWGEDNNNPSYVQTLRELQVDYVITDRIGMMET